MPEEPYRVLIVDDDPRQLSLVTHTLRKEGFDVSPIETAFGVHDELFNFAPDVVLFGERDADLVVSEARRYSHAVLVLYADVPASTIDDRIQLSELASRVGAEEGISKRDKLERLGKKLEKFITRAGRPRMRPVWRPR